MFLISSTPTEILLLLHGDKVASIQKDDVEDFIIGEVEFEDLGLGLIHFITKSEKRVQFAIPEGADFDNALVKLIEITDGMGI